MYVVLESLMISDLYITLTMGLAKRKSNKAAVGCSLVPHTVLLMPLRANKCTLVPV